MKDVKEYLDKNFLLLGESSCELKKNGHYCVFGHWIYPDNCLVQIEEFNKLSYSEHLLNKPPDHISVHINNETIFLNITVDGLNNRYGYLQTYEHIPRGLPDEYGYYARSTDEEIICYIDEFYKKIILNKSHIITYGK